MSVEDFLASQEKNKRPDFKKVAGKLLAEKEPIDTRPWKWEDEITEADWGKFEKGMKQDANLEHWLSCLSFAHTARILDPTHVLPPIPEKAWKHIQAQLKLEYQYKKRSTYFEHAATIHLVDPAHQPTIDANAWNGIDAVLAKLIEMGKWKSIAKISTEILLLDSNHPPPDIRVELEAMLQNVSYDFTQIIELASHARLLGLISVGHLPENEWKKMGLMLKAYQRQDINYFFMKILLEMRILAAHKVEITKDGIIITDKPPEQLDVTLPPRPKRKKI